MSEDSFEHFHDGSAYRAEIERLRAELAEEKAIVTRIWELLGNPSYEELKGRSIYDLIISLKEHAAQSRSRTR